MKWETVEYSKQLSSPDECRELNPQINIEDTIFYKDNDEELQASGSNTHSIEEVLQDLMLCRSIREKSSLSSFQD